MQGLGVGLTALRKGVTIGTDALRRRMLVKLEINNKDPSYDWFLAWMAQQSPAVTDQKPRLFSPRTWLRSHELSVQTAVEQRKNGSSSVGFKLVAGPGTHFLKFRKAWIQVSQMSCKVTSLDPPSNTETSFFKVKRERETRSQHLMSGIPWETVTLTTLSRDRGLFPELLAEARDIAMRNQEGKLVIHTPWGIEWKPFGLPRQKRPINSVVLEEGVSETIKQDVSAFLERRQWYADRGIAFLILIFHHLITLFV